MHVQFSEKTKLGVTFIQSVDDCGLNQVGDVGFHQSQVSLSICTLKACMCVCMYVCTAMFALHFWSIVARKGFNGSEVSYAVS